MSVLDASGADFGAIPQIDATVVGADDADDHEFLSSLAERIGQGGAMGRLSRGGLMAWNSQGDFRPAKDCGYYKQERQRRWSDGKHLSDQIGEGDIREVKECDCCNAVREKRRKDRQEALDQIAELRRGCDKFLEACSGLLSRADFSRLESTLQLNVGYLTRSEFKLGGEVEDEPALEEDLEPGDDGEADELRRMIKQLEDDIESAKENNDWLRQELQGGSAATTAGRQLPASRPKARQGKAKADAFMQTDPVKWAGEGDAESDEDEQEEHPATAGAPQAVSVVKVVKAPKAEKSPKEPKAAKASLETSPKRSRASGRAESGAVDQLSESSDDAVEVVHMARPGGAVRSKRPQPRRDPGGGGLTAEEAALLTQEQGEQIEDIENEIRKTTAEKDLLELKLKSAERSRGTLQDQLKTSETRAQSEESEICTVKRRIEEVERLIAVLQGEANSLKALKASRSKKNKKAVQESPLNAGSATETSGGQAAAPPPVPERSATDAGVVVQAASHKELIQTSASPHDPVSETVADCPSSPPVEVQDTQLETQSEMQLETPLETQPEPAWSSDPGRSSDGFFSPAGADIGDSSLMSSDEESEDPTENEGRERKTQTVDKCVGTDDLDVKVPEPANSAATPRRSTLPPREVNKSGHSFVRKVRSRVRLSLAGVPAGM